MIYKQTLELRDKLYADINREIEDECHVGAFFQATSWLKMLARVKRDFACSDAMINEINVLVGVLHNVITESKSRIDIVDQIAAGIE